MYIVNLYARLTFKYNDRYKHFDESKYIGSVKIPNWTKTDEGNCYEKGITRFTMIRKPANIKHKDFVKALDNEFSWYGCSHEWDCCGCSSAFIKIKKMTNRKYYIRQTISYNY